MSQQQQQLPQPYNGTTHLTFHTSTGAFTIELYYAHCPLTCRNMVMLADQGYYDNTVAHRVIKGFMVQMGDPTGTGRGGQSAVGINGGPFQDEITRALKHTGAGIVSMANSGPNTNKSQFFITLGPQPHLDGKHTVFGRISAGMSVVERMGMVKVGGQDRPVQDLKVLRVESIKGEVLNGGQ
jgi:peptidyl-prolyl cis-trans isomerase-like 1